MSNQSNTSVKSLNDTWLTVKLLSEKEPAFSESAIRNYVFNANDRHSSKGIIPGNGLAPHIRRIGSKVLINHGGFLSWIAGGAACYVLEVGAVAPAPADKADGTHRRETDKSENSMGGAI